jgi:hypothetical protein
MRHGRGRAVGSRPALACPLARAIDIENQAEKEYCVLIQHLKWLEWAKRRK